MSASSEGPVKGPAKGPAKGPTKGPTNGTAKGRRIAEKPAKPAKARRVPKAPKPPKPAKSAKASRDRRAATPEPGAAPVTRAPVGRMPALGAAAVGTSVLLAGLGALGCAVAGVGPHWVDGAGAIAVSTVLSVALGHRTGGRPVIALLLSLAIGLAAVIIGGPILQTGAAVLTVVVGGVYAVMATVPAVSFWRAAREVLIATAVSAITAVAAVGFEPTVTEPRFDYTSLLLSLALVFALVHRLGAGIHGLGRRGLIVVLVGVGVLVLTLAYGELLRRYGAGSVVGSALDFAAWTTDRIGAFPRPLVVFLGIPALLWGCFQRARRRQGWWVCAFGVTATVPMAEGLLAPGGSFFEAGLRVVYSLVLGLLIGYLLVRLDLALTAPRGRRGRRAEEADAHRPEPSRFAAL